MYSNYGLFINNEFIKGEQGSFDVINPFDEKVLGSISLASKKQVKLCIDLADNAFKEWNKLNAWEKAIKITNIAKNLESKKEEIAKILTLETGKPLSQSLREINLAIEQFIWFGEQTKRIEGKVLKSRVDSTEAYVKYEPIGIVGAFSSWNFPILLSARKIAPALAAGCPVIVRSTNVAPLVNMKLAEAIKEAGLPNGLVSVICGNANEVVDIISNDPRVRKISLTGSVSVGQELIKKSALTIKKVTMELGGHAPVIICDDVDVENVARLCAKQKFANAGQVCISPTRFYVDKKIMEEFCNYFVCETKNIKLGNGLMEGTDMGPLVNKKRLDEIENFIKSVARENIITGGKRPKEFEKGFFFEPTVVRDLENNSSLLCEEIFGPIAIIQSFSNLNDAINLANSTEYGLAAYAFTNNLEISNTLVSSISSGMVGINSFALAAAEIPFGGIKASGFGRESGIEGMQEYLVSKIVTMKYKL